MKTFSPETIYSFLDITTLESTDDIQKVRVLTEKIVQIFHDSSGDLCPAAICVYPNLISVVKEHIKELPIKAACVSGGFPSGQTFAEIKVKESELAVHYGADEVDMVINRGRFLQGDFDYTLTEIRDIKAAIGDKSLKVILETGELNSSENIYNASMIAIRGGAQFIKTSTGKSKISATPEAVETICNAIRDYYQSTKIKVGCKVSGGVASYQDAVVYLNIVHHVLGEEWITPSLFRIGASRLANDLLEKVNMNDIRI